jgi:hypothetical protein
MSHDFALIAPLASSAFLSFAALASPTEVTVPFTVNGADCVHVESRALAGGAALLAFRSSCLFDDGSLAGCAYVWNGGTAISTYFVQGGRRSQETRLKVPTDFQFNDTGVPGSGSRARFHAYVWMRQNCRREAIAP